MEAMSVTTTMTMRIMKSERPGGEREYFSDDLAQDYNSYYAQVADAADMGDQDAIDEMYGEFGEGEL